jgi:hypothetical protein
MADLLQAQGKIEGAKGIESAIVSVSLSEADQGGIATTAVTTTSFTVDDGVGGTGVLSNTAAISFTIEAADVGKTAAFVSINSTNGEMIRIDLDTPLLLSTEGTATFAIGDLTASL